MPVAATLAAAMEAWARSIPIPRAAREAETLAACFRGGRWDPSLLDELLAVGQEMGRLGELLAGLDGLAPAEAPACPFDPRVDSRAFALLDFAQTSAGIARTQRENREGWWAHARQSKAFILNAAASRREGRLAVVLGAGKAYDLPLKELAATFERVVLIDIDAEALRAASTAAVPDAQLRRRLELRTMDVTGVTAHLAQGIEQAVRLARDGREAEASLAALCGSYRLASPPRLLRPGERADLLISALLLSQLGLQPKLAAKRLFERRFGAIAPQAEAAWRHAWDCLELRIQQHHIDALTVQAELAVLTSDTVHHAAEGESWSVVGTARLEDRLPPACEIVARRSWSWPRIKSRAGAQGGVRTDVAAFLLRARAGPILRD